MYQDRINIKSLKDFAFTQLPKNSSLRDIILAESETIDTVTFLARLPIWLKLSVHIQENRRQMEYAARACSVAGASADKFLSRKESKSQKIKESSLERTVY